MASGKKQDFVSRHMLWVMILNIVAAAFEAPYVFLFEELSSGD